MGGLQIEHDIASLLADGVLDGGNVDTDDISRFPTEYDPVGLGMVAFGVWAYEAGRDIGLTQQILNQKTGMMIPVSQLREWRSVGGWSENYAKVHQALDGSLAETAQAMSRRGLVVAVRALVDIAGDKSVNPGARVRAANSLLDRAGMPVMMRGEMLSAIHLSQPSEYDDVSDDDLEAEYRSFNADTYNDRAEDAVETMNHKALLHNAMNSGTPGHN